MLGCGRTGPSGKEAIARRRRKVSGNKTVAVIVFDDELRPRALTGTAKRAERPRLLRRLTERKGRSVVRRDRDWRDQSDGFVVKCP